MPGGEQTRGETRRRRGLDAALEVFTRDGYGDPLGDDIARASDTSQGGGYFHFPRKQAPLLRLLDPARLARSPAATTGQPSRRARALKGRTHDDCSGHVA